jgi:hypothetical protein
MSNCWSSILQNPHEGLDALSKVAGAAEADNIPDARATGGAEQRRTYIKILGVPIYNITKIKNVNLTYINQLIIGYTLYFVNYKYFLYFSKLHYITKILFFHIIRK